MDPLGYGLPTEALGRKGRREITGRGGGIPAKFHNIKCVTWVFPPLHRNEYRRGERRKKIRERMSLQT